MGIRTFQDAEGKMWRVWLVQPQSEVLVSTSPELARGWLCFENDGEKRRLADPPDGWLESSDEHLIALLAGALPVNKASTG